MQRQLSISAMPKLLPEEEEHNDDDLEAKPEKAPPVRSWGKERSVHLIPLLIILCFLLLFLCSHDPSPSGMSTSGVGGKAGGRKTRSLL